MVDSIIEFVKKVLSLLPQDPFTEYIDMAAEYFADQKVMGYINYFVPIGLFVEISKRWIIAVGVYIVVRAIVKALKGEK